MSPKTDLGGGKWGSPYFKPVKDPFRTLYVILVGPRQEKMGLQNISGQRMPDQPVWFAG